MMNATMSFEDAAGVLAQPQNIEQAYQAVSVFGLEFALVAVLPLVVNFILGAFLGMWEDEDYWIVFGGHVLTVVGMVVLLPLLTSVA